MTGLRDMYTEEELPTKPATPVASARRCKHCRKVYGDHAEIFPSDLEVECFGVRVNFEPEETSDAEQHR